MKKFMDVISAEMAKAFEQAGYEASYGKVSVSNRPDLCEYQCNGAMAGAKAYKKAPIMIANEVAALLKDSEVFSEVTAVMPGFLNCRRKNLVWKCRKILKPWWWITVDQMLQSLFM